MPLVMKLLRPHFAPPSDEGLGGGGSSSGGGGGAAGAAAAAGAGAGAGAGNGDPSPLTSRPGGVFRLAPGVDPVALVLQSSAPSSDGSANEEWTPSLLLQARDVKMGMATVEYFQEQMRLAGGDFSHGRVSDDAIATHEDGAQDFNENGANQQKTQGE